MWSFSDITSFADFVLKLKEIIIDLKLYLILGVIFLFMLYILNAISVFSISKKENFQNPWLAFVPILNLSLLGKLADLNKQKDDKKNYKYERFLPILFIIELFFLILFLILLAFCLMSVLTKVETAIEKDADLNSNLVAFVAPVGICYIFLFAVALLYTIFYKIALWHIFSYYSPKFAVLFLVFSILFGFLAPIFLFVIRNNPPATEQKEEFLFDF